MVEKDGSGVMGMCEGWWGVVWDGICWGGILGGICVSIGWGGCEVWDRGGRVERDVGRCGGVW